MLMTRIEAAAELGVSVHTLARASSDAAFGQPLEDAGLLPPDVGVPFSPAYCVEDVRRCLAVRADPAVAKRLRAVTRRVK